MSGHSKWAQIKHKKAVTDARRGRLFSRLLREITVAARLGGGDLDGNPRLRAAVNEAKAASVAKETIERAIKKGTGALAGEAFEEVTLEAYGPGGGAILIAAVTDNRNRTVGELRHLLERNGGNLGESGCVSWLFAKRGYFAIARTAMAEDALVELALELGAEDVDTGDPYALFTAAEDFQRVREELERRKVPLAASELSMVPKSFVRVEGAKARQALRLLEAIEDQEDVQHVWANFDIDENVLAGAGE